MKKAILFVFLFIFLLLYRPASYAQVIPVSSVWNKSATVILLSDSTTRSALICNILPDRSGALSPLIGTGTWEDNGKEVQVNSLLYFDLSQIKDIRPEDILKAWLMMVPISSDLEVFNPSSTRIRIRRVLENWVDTSATWSNQPAISEEHIASYMLKKPDTNNFYKFNVSKLVRDMLRFGNFGFEISFSNKNENPNFGRLYYSPRVGAEEIRPMLVLEVAGTNTTYYRDANANNQRIESFNLFNQTMPMYDKRQMIEYMKPPVERPAQPSPPPAKSEN